MTARDETRRMAEVMLASAEGARVQCRERCGSAEWDDVNAPVWNWLGYDYRVKPKPRTGWMVDGGAIPLRIFGSPEEARRYAASFGNERPPVVHMREVME